MTTTPLLKSSAAGATGTQSAAGKKAMTSDDFLNLMVTQLEHQDPMQPTSSSDLLAQMSQIGQLQSSTTLQSSLKGMFLQNSISSASSMIGKNVHGMDVNNNTINGVVNSIKVQDDGVSLELDNGQSLSLSRVTNVAPGPGAATAGTAATTAKVGA